LTVNLKFEFLPHQWPQVSATEKPFLSLISLSPLLITRPHTLSLSPTLSLLFNSLSLSLSLSFRFPPTLVPPPFPLSFITPPSFSLPHPFSVSSPLWRRSLSPSCFALFLSCVLCFTDSNLVSLPRTRGLLQP
jgi:hypothetical protein